ncbi:MAG: GGDEF domain-containing protein, partial [Oscillibacter sp.]|nr:GGDEF domain-containing protein [Oscillibacter sp.]
QNIKNDLKLYIPLVHAQAYTDGLTGVGNKAAYLELVHELDEKIAEGTARFSLAVFDINGLKAVNDDYGHEEGDETIVGAAECIKEVFGKENVFRIGGDEFIAVLPDLSEEDMAKAFERLDREVESANAALADTDGGAPVSFSKGAVTFDPNVDREFKTVFKRADEAMYRNKGDYYRQFGDRRKKE